MRDKCIGDLSVSFYNARTQIQLYVNEEINTKEKQDFFRFFLQFFVRSFPSLYFNLIL